MIGIINYGQGNLGSIKNMLWRIGEKSEIVSDSHELLKMNKLILPGVGTFDTGMEKLNKGGWIEVLRERVLSDKIPTLGICLGMQLLTNKSEEGELPGLGFIDAEVVKFQFKDSNLKVPHMGWNIAVSSKESDLLQDTFNENRFYFAHSYYVKLENIENQILSSEYGFRFTSGFENENILGLQFHPEKSHKFGMAILKNFVNNY